MAMRRCATPRTYEDSFFTEDLLALGIDRRVFNRVLDLTEIRVLAAGKRLSQGGWRVTKSRTTSQTAERLVKHFQKIQRDEDLAASLLVSDWGIR